MAILVIGNVPGGNAEMDQQMMQSIGVSADNPPAGGLVRLSGPVEGGYRVITVWESQEAWDAFKRDRLEPFFQKAGREFPAFEVSPLDGFMVPK